MNPFRAFIFRRAAEKVKITSNPRAIIQNLSKTLLEKHKRQVLCPLFGGSHGEKTAESQCYVIWMAECEFYFDQERNFSRPNIN